jgi:hypothetical protein
MPISHLKTQGAPRRRLANIARRSALKRQRGQAQVA